jgi:hypothetical protein
VRAGQRRELLIGALHLELEAVEHHELALDVVRNRDLVGLRVVADPILKRRRRPGANPDQLRPGPPPNVVDQHRAALDQDLPAAAQRLELPGHGGRDMDRRQIDPARGFAQGLSVPPVVLDAACPHAQLLDQGFWHHAHLVSACQRGVGDQERLGRGLEDHP